MCGIIGFVGQVPDGMWGQTYSIIRELFIAAEHRGRNATGFVAATEPVGKSTSRTIISKRTLRASRFIETDRTFQRLQHRRCLAFVGHVRLATHGSPKDSRNNHPHVGKHFALVHNGIITNAAELLDRHSLKIQSGCDSEVLLRMVEASPHSALGLDQCLREVRGSMAVALYDQKERLVWLARNGGRPLWVARLEHDRRVFFASTAAIILESLRRVLGSRVLRRLELLLPVPADAPIALSVEGRIIAPLMAE